jgi:Alr-MurF fusion protein
MMARGYRMSDLAAAMGGEVHLVQDDECITTLVIDSRRSFDPVGSLFFALSGPHHDGHRFIGASAERGLRNVVVRKGAAFEGKGLNTITVEDTLAALQRTAAWHRKHFTCPVIGITGSNGKTVVKEWLYEVLHSEEHIMRSPGSWNSQVGVPLSVWEMEDSHTLGIFEAGISEPGEMAPLADIIAPTIGIFTNVGPAHGRAFTDDRSKAVEKARLFATSDVIIFCQDHLLVHEALQVSGVLGYAHPRAWSRQEDAWLRVIRESVKNGITTLALRQGDQRFDVHVPFVDQAGVENALHVITALLHLGRSGTWIAERIAHLGPMAMRLRSVATTDGGTLIDDAYSNDLTSLAIALDHLNVHGHGRPRVAVISDILDSGSSPVDLYARMAEQLRRADVHHVFGIGPGLSEHIHLFGLSAQAFADTASFLKAFPSPPVQRSVTLVKGARAFGLEQVVEHWQERDHGTVLEIDHEALRENLNHYRALVGPEVRVMAMLKADAYGSGAVELARLFAHERVAYVGVAYVDEGVELRRNGIRLPVLVMNPEPMPFARLHRYRLESEVYDRRSLEAAIAFAQQEADAPPVHIEVDTGMRRLGFAWEELPELLEMLRGTGPLRVASVMSHLAAAEDPTQDAFTTQQLDRFEHAMRGITETLGYRPLAHIANSAGATRFPQARLDMVRLGIGLHGIGADARETELLRPITRLSSVIAQLRTIAPGETVSYGRTFRAERRTTLAVLPIGYADGLPRRLSNGVGRVWINGRAAPFAGIICMDMCMVDVTDVPCSVGEAAVLFGPGHPVQDLAKAAGTIPYEVLTGISPRVKRIHLRG